MIHTLWAEIEKRIPLSEADKTFCAPYFEQVTVSKNTIVEEENKMPKHLYFVAKGFMRSFYYDENGDEITTLIASPNAFITSFLDFINQRNSMENIECITDCELFKIERNTIMELIEKNEKFKQFSLTIFEQAISNSQSRANDLATLSAEQRYKKILTQQASIIQNVPIQYIASYLGIKPQSLSRIRKQITSI